MRYTNRAREVGDSAAARFAGSAPISLFRSWGLRPRLYSATCSAGSGRDMAQRYCFAGSGRDMAQRYCFAGSGQNCFKRYCFAGSGRDMAQGYCFAGSGRDMAQRYSSQVRAKLLQALLFRRFRQNLLSVTASQA
jgi:hypothetical protein